MMEIIIQIIFCMIAAALLGFIIGWIFSSLLRNEKHQSQLLAVKETFDEQRAQISLLETEIDTKKREMLMAKKQYSVLQDEMTSNQSDSKDAQILHSKISDLEGENLLLLEQIKEQKICDDEKEILEDTVQGLQSEKQTLIKRIEELKEFETSYKDNIHRIAELESHQNREQTPLVYKKKRDKKNKKQIETDGKKNIQDKKELTSKDNDAEKISKIIQNLFPNTKD